MTGSGLRTARRVGVGHRAPQPARDLPVAAHPAVLPRRERQVVRRVVVDRARCRCTARRAHRALEQVVAQERVLGHAAAERRFERVDVVDALADVAAFVKQILIDVRDGGRVRIDADVPGEHLREQRCGWR